jgi:hypothetical protein
MKQQLISLALFLLFLSACIRVTDLFLETSAPSEELLMSSAFPLFGAHYEGFPSTYLVAGGDIMLSRNIGYYNKKNGYTRIFGSGTYNPISEFTNCHAGDCMLFFNLESLFHPRDNDIQMGGFTFRANVANIEVLKGLRKPSAYQANDLG